MKYHNIYSNEGHVLMGVNEQMASDLQDEGMIFWHDGCGEYKIGFKTETRRLYPPQYTFSELFLRLLELAVP